ncbi:MAG: hypothetical protein K0U41_06570 [Gammaproteobacteria bacterium]|nr:hypothetical protein [Gammaproteobacteria bacterium]
MAIPYCPSATEPTQEDFKTYTTEATVPQSSTYLDLIRSQLAKGDHIQAHLFTQKIIEESLVELLNENEKLRNAYSTQRKDHRYAQACLHSDYKQKIDGLTDKLNKFNLLMNKPMEGEDEEVHA